MPQATEPLGHEVLTDRELEVLRLLQGSLSLSEIAGELYISPNTVKTHAKAVYRKLGVGSRDRGGPDRPREPAGLGRRRGLCPVCTWASRAFAISPG